MARRSPIVSGSLVLTAVFVGLYLLVVTLTSDTIGMELPITVVSPHILEFLLLIAISFSIGIAITSVGEQI